MPNPIANLVRLDRRVLVHLGQHDDGDRHAAAIARSLPVLPRLRWMRRWHVRSRAVTGALTRLERLGLVDSELVVRFPAGAPRRCYRLTRTNEKGTGR